MLATGATIAGYRIDGLLGTGGMAVVYEATQLSLDRTVALKVIAPHLGLDPTFRERFRREAKLQAALDHPNIVSVYEAGESAAGLFLAMRLVRGPSLKELVLGGGLDAERALAILAQVASALDAAHEAGLIHRDVKPQNILVDEQGEGFLADFGLIKSAAQRGVTGSGHYLGTLDYVAPEQIRGEPVSALSDVYAFAAVLYECLSGEVPFPRETEAALLYAHLTEPPPRLAERRAELPDLLDEVVGRGLAKRPADRYRTASQLVADARAALALKPLSLSQQTTIPPMPDGSSNGRRRPGFGSTISDPAVFREAPALEGRPPRHLSRGWIAALGAIVLALASAGFVLGRARDDGGRPPTAVAVGGPVSLEFPSDEWAPARQTLEIPGLALADPVALTSAAPDDPGDLVAGSAQTAEGPLLLPASLIGELARPPRAEPVRLGRYEALRFRRVLHPRVTGSLTLYVVPTNRGGAVVACRARAGQVAGRAALPHCEEVAATLELRGVEALPIRANRAYAARRDQALELLNARRALERRTLAAARTPKAQARAAARLASAYRSAAALLAAERPGPVERPGHRASLGAIRRAQSAYGRLAAAARSGRRPAYRRAAAAVVRAEAALGRAARQP